MKNSDQPFIEDILEKYSSIENLHILALGSSYWNPPPEVLQTLTINETSIHRYGGILGLDSLRNIIKKRLKRRGIDTNDLDIVITAGANQGFINIALALCDPNQSAGKIQCYVT
jgi:aspartate/methionine/tyrosine aminotransferase